MTETAKIVRFYEAGAATVLRFDELPLPTPGPGEVRLRIKAIGLNRAEILFRYGHYMEQPVFPSKNGTEASGVIDAVGEGVDLGWIGKTVATIPGTFPLGNGVYGEVAVVPVRGVAEYPAALSYEEGAAIWMQYLTAYGALVWLGKTAPGDFVVITAASSSVGVAAIQMIKAEGAISIAVTRTVAKKEQLLALGADYVIVTDEEDLATRVSEITGGKGARISFDPIGGSIMDALANAAAMDGLIFEYGAMAQEPTPFPLFAALGKHLAIRGYQVAEIPASPVFEQAKRYVFDKLASGTLKPLISKVFPFADFVEAHRFMESNAQVGKIIIRVS